MPKKAAEVKLYNPFPCKPVREGSAEIVSGGDVFYNPVQEFNRDLSVAVLNVYFKRVRQEEVARKLTFNVIAEERTYTPGVKYQDGLRLFEALSATGLRSIRYAKEVAGIKEIITNDFSKQAVDAIKVNVQKNEVGHLITPRNSDAMKVMYNSNLPNGRFDVIDLDPYGCPNRYLDGAVQSINDGGLLLVTATDMAVLAGNTPEACYVKYGTVPLRSKCCHEMALRILLRAIDGHANRHGKYIEPLLSVSVDFYIRVFVRVYSSQAETKFSMSKHSMVFQCTGCETLTLQPLGNVKPNPTEENPEQKKFGIPTGPQIGQNCEHCGHKHHLGGPIWNAPLHDKTFVNELLQEVQKEPLSQLNTNARIVGVLSVIEEELTDVPLYYSLEKMCSVVKLEVMPILKFRSALLHAGYKVSFSHAYKSSIKTDAPPSVLWDILRCWNEVHPVNESRMLEGTPVKAILSIPPTIKYELLEIHPEANPSSRRNALTRFPENPLPHWGPGTKATSMVGEGKHLKSYKNQNKKQKKKRLTAEASGEGHEDKQPKLDL